MRLILWLASQKKCFAKTSFFFFFTGENTLQVQPLHPPSAPLLAVAQISSRQSCQLQRECLLFSHSLWKESGGSSSHACIPGRCRPLSSGLWSFVFPQSCRRRDTRLGQLTSRLQVLKPTRRAWDFLMSQSQAEHWKAASRGGGQRGGFAGDTTRTGKKQAEVAFRELQVSVRPQDDRKKYKKVLI